MKPLFQITERFHGKGPVIFAWQPDGNFLATAGVNGLVHIFDRHGEQIEEVPLSHSGQCLALDWDKDGEVLAILQAGNSQVPLWDQATREVTYMETNLKDPTFISWSKTGPQLAIGTAKGNLLLYRKDNRKKIPIIGKHTKKIVCGAWSAANTLALGGADNMLTLSNADGDTIEQTELKYEAVDIQFAMQKTDTRGRAEGKTVERPENTVSINMGKRTVLLYNLDDPDNPVELAFQAKYGHIVTYRWFGDGYMMIGFSEGYVVVISTHMREIGEELFSGKFHKDSLDDIACSPVMQRAATAGGSVIKIIDMADWKELKSEAAVVERKHGPIEKLAWTSDGQILTAATASGTIYNFLARMPTIHDAYDTRVAYLSSLREISVIDTMAEGVLSLPVSIEPSFVALGPMHVAVGMNNRVWYYRCDGSSRDLVNEREYLSTVDAVRLNRDYAAVLCEGRVHLQLIEPHAQVERDNKLFPERDDGAAVTCCALTPNFLIYGTEAGTIELFYVDDWTMLAGSEHRHDEPIRSIYPNPSGTRLIFLDARHAGYLYNPVNSLVLPVPKLHDSTAHIMWDGADWGVFITTDGAEFNTYIHSPLTINGPQIVQLGSLDIRHNGDMIMEPRPTKVPYGHVPVLAYNGVVTCQLQNGSLMTLTLHTHDALNDGGGASNSERLRAAFAQNLALLRLKDAWEVAFLLNSRAYWLALSGKAMEQLNIEMALRVYRELGDAGMVMALEDIRHVEDKNLLAGHVAMLFADYGQAQELFLTSTRPVTALEMRRDLLHWDHALKLAETLAPRQVPELSVEYAKQLEFKGEYSQALRMYESASGGVDSSTAKGATLAASCRAGVARMTLRLGDVRRGLQLCSDIGDKQLYRDGAGILESLKQFADAASLYTKAEEFDKAAGILIQSKNFTAVAPLMESKVTQPRLHAQYAKAKEMMKDYKEAARAYERARDMDSVVRILLDHLNQPGAASEIVRKSQSSDGAQMVAKFLREAGDFRGAIEFLLLAKRGDDAFELAKAHDEMGVYASQLGSNGTHEENMRIATYYESKSKWGKAGEFFAICGQYHKALKLFLQCGESEMDKAIEVVGKARSDMLTHTLIDFLMGETDGVPKDPNYIFRLYMALGNYPQAGKTAIIISRQEQELGNYKVAHSILFETHKDLEGQSIRVPQALSRSLRLLHSYILVKKLVKQNNHEAAARMLIRVAKNISKFPSHIVPILTSTVIECQRAGLKRSAFDYASMLMRPEYRSQIEPKLKRKIEQLVRRPNKDEAEETTTPCPYCSNPLASSALECPQCMNTIPYCIATGRHMDLGEWSFCPNCQFPALLDPFRMYLASDTKCPMCDTDVDPAKVKRLTMEEAKGVLQKFKAGPEEEGDEEGAEDGEEGKAAEGKADAAGAGAGAAAR